MSRLSGLCNFSKAGSHTGPAANLVDWRFGNADHRIRHAADYEHHKSYVEQNPVRAHLVERPEDYLYSSARSGFELDPVPQWLKPR